MRIIIIDESKRGMQIMRRFIAKKIPDVQVTELDPEQHGVPGPAFDWSLYDALILTHEMSNGSSGLDWFEHLSAHPEFPPTVLVTAKNDSNVTSQALRMGVLQVMSKRDLTPDLLSDAVREAASHAKIGQADPGLARQASDTQIVDEAGDGHRYRFGRLIGQGGMSRVYLAERLQDGATVVIKILDGSFSQDSESVQRFVLEAELASKIDSPYVVEILEQGFTKQFGFMAMEFFAGGDLKQRLEDDLAPFEAMTYALEIACGLEAIHAVGIIHRDLKPANIMFRADDTLAIADFGISKALDATQDLTMAGSVLGTPSYISPEQAQSLPADERSDLYSLGVMMFELLAGRKPYQSESMAGLFFSHIRGEIPSLPHRVSQYDTIVRRLMAKDPNDRYQTASELIAALRPHVPG